MRLVNSASLVLMIWKLVFMFLRLYFLLLFFRLSGVDVCTSLMLTFSRELSGGRSLSRVTEFVVLNT